MAQQKPAGASDNDSDAAGVTDPRDLGEDIVDELAPGTKLLKGQYTIVRYINSGGFGITYLAKDSLDRDVVIKECFPSSFCRRSKALVAARSRAHSAELRSIVQLFVREARSLAKIVHPNIVAVHQVFEDNGTAYMAIDYINGLDLQQIIEGQGKMPKADEIVLVTEKLLAAVGFIHANDMLHRDISPDNVLLDIKGEPILIDFGAARDQASKTNRAMSALRVVKDGYSPQEFYVAGSEQGPWSDLYALGATLYHLISGEAPVNGQARLAALAEEKPDPYLPLAGRFQGFPDGFLAAIDKAMSTLPKNRVQTAQEWLSMFQPGIELPLTPGDNIAAAVHAMVVNSRIDALSIAQPAPPAAPGADASFGAPPQFARQVSKQPPVAGDALAESFNDRFAMVEDDEAATDIPPAPAPVARKGGLGPVQLILGGVLAVAILGIGLTQFGGGSDPEATAEDAAPLAPEDAAETAEAPTEQPAEKAVAVADPAVTLPPLGATDEAAPSPDPEAEADIAADTAADTAAEEVAVADPVAPEPEPETPVETEATDDVAAAVAAAGIDPADLAQNQIAFAAWDVAMPFLEENRMIAGERVAIVASLLPSANLDEVGDWLAPGLILYSVNGVDIQQGGSVVTAVLNAMQVDPDGRARVVVEYAGDTLDRQSGLLTVEAQRLVSLQNGVRVTLRVVDQVWQAEVTAVINPSITDLRQGDILFRERSTGTALATPDSLEAVMAALVAAGTTVASFSIIRDNKVEVATMQLAVAENP